MQMTPIAMRSTARRRGSRTMRRISTYTWPRSRTSHGAPRHGTRSSAYSVKVKKCPELWKPRLRTTTSRVMTPIIAAISRPAHHAMPYSTASYAFLIEIGL
jgi:hypothetical protein